MWLGRGAELPFARAIKPNQRETVNVIITVI